jgi:hypothetical protein
MNINSPFAAFGNNDSLGLWIDIGVLSAIQSDPLNPMALGNA